MERQYTRIDSVRELLDRDLKAITDEELKRCAYNLRRTLPACVKQFRITAGKMRRGFPLRKC